IRAREGNQSSVSDRQIAEQKIRLNTTIRQQNNERYQEFKAEQLLEVENSNATVDQIIAAYARIRQEAQATGQSPVVQKRLDVEEQNHVQRAQEKQFTDSQSEVRTYEEIARARLAISKAENDQRVALHEESKAQALAIERQFTEQQYAQIRQRVE